MMLIALGWTQVFVLSLFLSIAPATAQDSANLQADRFRGTYERPKNPAHQHIYDRLRSQSALERIGEFLSPFRLPREVLMKSEGCDGVVNAFYEEGVITVCYEYIEYIYSNMPKEPIPGGLTPEDAVLGPTVDVFLHEAAHAVFDLLEVPVFGHEEGAADLFSAYLQLQVGKEEARVLIIGTAFLGQKETQEIMGRSLELKDFANEHGLPAQRFFNFLCIAYGFDPQLFADAVSHWRLPTERAEGCEDEYAQLDHAFQTLVMPYIDKGRMEKVRARKWLQFEVQR